MAKMPCSRFIMHREFLELKNRRRLKMRGITDTGSCDPKTGIYGSCQAWI